MGLVGEGMKQRDAGRGGGGGNDLYALSNTQEISVREEEEEIVNLGDMVTDAFTGFNNLLLISTYFKGENGCK